jgi:STE24 endopeptidase
MNTNSILILYLILFGVQYLWETLLSLLNRRHVRAKRLDPPPFVKSIMDEKTYQRSVEYTLTRSGFGLLAGTASSAFLLVLILTGSLGHLERLVSALGVGVYTRGVLFFFLISIMFSLFSLPFSLYRQFVIEERFGFNRMSWKLFALDILKGVLISVAFVTPLLYGLFWFMDRAGDLWWLYAFGAFTLFQLIVLILYPTLIAPLFNKFTPLEEGTLKDKILSLAERLGFRTRGIFVMDGSKRSSHSNAYFTGLGRVKRIVLFDTLIEQMEDEELTAVLAHEIGHEKKQHVKKHLALSLAATLLGFYILSLLLPYAPFFRAFGFEAPSYHAAVVILSFCAAPFTFFLKPLLALLSRRHEYEADRYAVDAVQGAEGLKSALRRLGEKNLSNLTPHPWYSFYHYSHPTISERVAAMDDYALERGRSVVEGAPG